MNIITADALHYKSYTYYLKSIYIELFQKLTLKFLKYSDKWFILCRIYIYSNYKCVPSIESYNKRVHNGVSFLYCYNTYDDSLLHRIYFIFQGNFHLVSRDINQEETIFVIFFTLLSKFGLMS